IISKNSVESKWVKKELSLAMTKEVLNKKVVVLPVLIDDCDLPDNLSDKIYADFRGTQGSVIEFMRLVRSMGALGDFEPPLNTYQLEIYRAWRHLELHWASTHIHNHRHVIELWTGNQIASLRPSRLFPRPRVFILWHDEGLTRADALSLVASLDEIDAEGVIA